MPTEARAARRIRHHIENLASDIFDVSVRAEHNLIRYYGARATTYLIEACDHPLPQVRFRAVWALAATREPRAHEVVLRLTSDPDERVSYDATVALSEFGDARAIQPLFEMILQKDGTRPARLRGFGVRALDLLRRLLTMEDDDLRLAAINDVGYIRWKTGSSECTEILSAHLADPNEEIRDESRYWLEQVETVV